MSRVRIVCLGNELVADDGIGVRVGRVLAGLSLPPEIVVEFLHGVGLELLDGLSAEEALLVVDATQTGAPVGTVQFFELEAVEQMAQTPYCCHGMGLAEVLALGQRLAPERLPKRAAVLGIEAKILDRFDTQLSPEVAAALPEAVDQALAYAGADGKLRQAARQQAEKLKHWTPNPADVPGQP